MPHRIAALWIGCLSLLVSTSFTLHLYPLTGKFSGSPVLTAALLQYTVSVVGTLPNGQASPAANTLPMTMPAARC